MTTTLAPSTDTAAAIDAPVSAAPVVVSDSSDTSAAPTNPMDLSDADLAARYGATDPAEAVEDATDATREAVPAAPDPEPDAATDEVTPASETSASPSAPPITPFAVFDAEGEVEIPAITVTFKAGGKEYEKLPLDRVVRMAQSAPLADKWRADAEQVPVLQQTLEQARAEVQQAVEQMQQENALYERLLANPDLYVQAVEAYQQMQSPEAKAARAEQELAALRAQQEENNRQGQTQQLLSQMAQYAATEIAPVVESLSAQYAATIDADEFQDRFHRLTADLLESGPLGKPWVPPGKLAEVARRVQTDLSQWAATTAQKRSQSTLAATQQASTQVQKAQQQAQEAKRQLARVAAPARTAVSPDVPRQKPIKTTNDAVEASLEKVRQLARQYGG